MKRQVWLGVGLLVIIVSALVFTKELQVTVGQEEFVSSAGGGERVLSGELLISPYGVWEELAVLFSEADYELRVWIYMATYPQTIQLWQNLLALGVDLHLIVESSLYGDSTKEFSALQADLEPRGGKLIGDEALGTNFMHAKAAVIDDEHYLISSANLTYPSLWRNREYRFIGHDAEIVESLTYIFDQDRAGEPIDPARIDPALLVCPIDCRADIVAALSGADERIWIATQYIQDREIVELLQTKAEEVELLLLVSNNQAPGWLEEFGTGVRYMGNPYLHAKNILIDDEVLILGSTNLSTNALDHNREISIAINTPSILRDFVWQFEDDWESARLELR